MPKSFGYLSEGDPNFHGALKFVMEKQPPRRGSMLRNGSRRVCASDHEAAGEQSGTPQEGRPLEVSDDESREILGSTRCQQETISHYLIIHSRRLRIYLVRH
jgi:hypothetical protein